MAGLKFYLDLAQISQSGAEGPVEPKVHSGPEPKMPKSLAGIGCPLLARNGSAEPAARCPLTGVERKSAVRGQTDANDPFRTTHPNSST